MRYNFPFDTCETPTNDVVQQPWSSLVNFIGVLILCYWVCLAWYRRKPVAVCMVIMSILLFEILHFTSHVRHLAASHRQVVMVHLSAYLVILCYLWAMYTTFGLPSSSVLVIAVFVATALADIVFFIQHRPFIWYMLTTIIMFILIFIMYYGYFDPRQKRYVWQIIICAIIIGLLFLNEYAHCQSMLRWNKHIPYHAMIELLGIALFILIPSFFMSLKKRA